MKDLTALILAAGKGTRMKSNLCKVLHPVAGRPMLAYVLDAVRGVGIARSVVVVGHQAEDVMSAVAGAGIEFARQEPQLGTGHAVSAARDALGDFPGHVLILCGDVPLIREETIRACMEFHRERASRVTVMTVNHPRPGSYGRIIRNDAGSVDRIVEARDAALDELEVLEINTGIYLVEARLLYELVARIGNENAQREYYLTDVVAEAVRDGITVHGFVLEDPDEVIGINSRSELAAVAGIIWERRREELMASGVTMLDPSTVYVDAGVSVGPDTVIHPNVFLAGKTKIGAGCVIESGVMITDCVLADGVKVLLGSRMEKSVVGEGTQIGPMAHLRPEARIGAHARIGNYVEVKKSVVGDGSKASHLTYLGDSLIGKNVNVGCGTITCNYDGRKKHPTTIGDNVFVGSDVQFVAPVQIGEGALIGAGSTITKDVPAGMLAVTRSRQKMFPLRKGQGSKTADEDR